MDFLDAGAVFPPDFIFDPAPAAQPAGTQEAHQSLFESIVLNTSDVVLVGKIRQYDPFVCEVQYVNPAFERRSGRPLAELAGCPVEHLFGAETEDQAGHLRAAAFARAPVNAEFRFRSGDGSDFRVAMTVVPSAGTGAGVLLICTGHEITAPGTGDIQETLHVLEERFRIVAESTSDIIYEGDLASGRFETFDTAHRYLGIPLAGKHWKFEDWENLVHPQDRPRVLQAFRRALETGAPFQEEYRIVLGGGSMRYWLVRGMVIYDSSGKPSRWVGAVADITKRKHDEENLARLAAIVRDSGDAIIGVDLNDAVVSWNAGAERLYGYSAGEMIGRSISVLVPEECAREQQNFLERMKAGEWLEHVETVRLRRDGSRVFVSLTASPIRDTEGNLIGLSKTARNITARKRAEAEIRAMNEELRRLSAELLRSQDEERRRIARELHDSTGQSIAALTMNLELLSRVAPAADPRVRSLLEDSIALAKQSSREVRDLCYLLHPPLLDELGLPSALRAHIDGFSKRTGIKVDLRLPPGFGRLPASTELVLYRIAQEALANVQRHSGSPCAKVTLTCLENQVGLEVADEGRGIEPGRAISFGVGLSGMRERVRQLGGTLDIAFRKTGTVLKAELPV